MGTFIYLISVVIIFSGDTYGQIESIMKIDYNLRHIFFTNNNINVTNGFSVSNECSKYLKFFKEELLKEEMWAMQMLDASSGFPSGILKGNLVDLGTFDECININVHSRIGKILGKYCRADLTLNRKKVTDRLEIYRLIREDPDLWFMPEPSIAICIPHVCSERDVEILFQRLQMDVLVKFGACKTMDTYPVLDYRGKAFLCFLCALIFLTLVSTAIDVIGYYRGKSSSSWLVSAFSAIKNGKDMLDSTSRANEVSCVNGIRVISIACIIYGHVFLYGYRYPTRNIAHVHEVSSSFLQMVEVISTSNVDTFLLISGAMITIGIINDSKRGYKFDIKKFYLRRILRIMPCFFVVVLTYTLLLEYVTYGPLTDIRTYVEIYQCKWNWWTSLLFMHNYKNTLSMCFAMSWYLAVDMQLYLLSPILIICLLRAPKFSLMIAVFLSFCCMVSSFMVTWYKKLPYFSISYLNDYYYLTHMRAAPWFIGFILGYILSTRPEGKPKMLNKGTTVVCWLLWLLAIILQFVFANLTDNIVTCLENTIRRLLWVLAHSWIIYSCHFGYANIINTFLSLPVFKILSKLNYCNYLVHGSLIIIMKGNMRATPYVTHFETFCQTCGIWVVTHFVALILHLTIESPVSTFEKAILKHKKD